MDNYNIVDNPPQTGYNVDNEVNDGEEVIRMAGRPSLNDPNCEHEFAEDPTDVIGDKVAWVCIKPNCGVGHFRKR